MKNKKIVLYSGLLIVTSLVSLYGMNQDDMHPIIKKQVDDVNQKIEKDSVGLSSDSCDILGLHGWRRDELATIALEAGSLMPDKQKLEYLQGDVYFKERKKIIKNLIEDKSVDPNSITYHLNKTPLYEAVLFKDDGFIQYLLEKGAKAD